ncbi:bile acid:sodium symporter family protein [Candidatus Latescibacterota bacterium]
MTLNQPDTTSLPNNNNVFYSLLRTLCLISVIAVLTFIVVKKYAFIGPFAIAIPLTLAIYVRKLPVLSVTSFSLWMIASITAPMFYPSFFMSWGSFKLSVLVIPLIQFIMFGMGTTLSVDDFKRVFFMPHAVLIGVILQFTVMPFVGRGVASVFTSNPEVAAGIVLTGSSPGGVASNVITYLASGNVALSVTMTAISTLLAPFMTPTMTKWLAGAYIEIDFWKMMLSIIKMVIIPVGSGIIVNTILTRLGKMHHNLLAVNNLIMRSLPGLAMFAICFACAIMTAGARDQLLIGSIVISIVLSVMAHNAIGLILGYWGARLFRLGERECRTIAIEVGLQNSGMAAGLALTVLKSQLAAVPGVVYSSWHNITGAVLASWWSRRNTEE